MYKGKDWLIFMISIGVYNPMFQYLNKAHNHARLSYYKVSQSFLVDLFFIGFMLKVAGVGRSRPWDIDPDRNTVHPLLIETCLRLVGTQIPYNKRSYDTISDEEANRQIY